MMATISGVNTSNPLGMDTQTLRRSKRIQGKKIYLDEEDSTWEDDFVEPMEFDVKNNYSRKGKRETEVKVQSAAVTNPRRKRSSGGCTFPRFSSPDMPGSGCCHHCKNKKDFWVGCPFVEAHRYCDGCIERHFSISYEAFTLSPEKYWVDGCPICNVTCPCAACRRSREKKGDPQHSVISVQKKRKRSDEEDEDDDAEDENVNDVILTKKRTGPISKRRKGSLPSVDAKLAKELKALREKNEFNEHNSKPTAPTRVSPRRRRGSIVNVSNGHYEIPAELGVEALVGLVGAAEALSRRPNFSDVKRRTEYMKLISF
eukprot:TRINITY_DN4082_c0_g3_i6.p1 TRINITY_DN4082_c0_g3~~TRINITY_DN4082_c0_g3_i6.p1  ORF type:complete len:315 (+),score=58.85 TRINITY_DN4082_c0_g3_i6:155-1099(+)